MHRNCLIFGTKVNVGNTYTLAILKRLKNEVFPTFHQIGLSELSDFGNKVNLGNSYTLAIFKLFGKILIPSYPP